MIKPSTVLSRFAAAATGTSNVSDVLPDGTISNMPWRKSGVKYTQNEIYIDIVEEIDSIIGTTLTLTPLTHPPYIPINFFFPPQTPTAMWFPPKLVAS